LLCLLDLDWNWLLILDDDLGLGGSNTDWWPGNLRLRWLGNELRNDSWSQRYLGWLLLNRDRLEWLGDLGVNDAILNETFLDWGVINWDLID
jgi:hypothetical protein